jgi:hypothetical protein
MNPLEHLPPRLLTRRQMLRQMGTGLGMLGFTTLLNAAGLFVPAAGAASANPLAARPPQFAPRAKRIIHIYLNGGPSQLDTFDPKPALAKWADKIIPTGNLTTERPTGVALPSPFKFARYGQSGIEVSEIFAKTAQQGIEVSFRTGLLPRRATMVDLSSRGCRLLSSYALEPGRRVCVQVPDRERDPLLVRGQVVRISLDEHLGPGGPYSAAVAFDALADAEQQRLGSVLARRALGHATLVGEAGDALLLPPEARGEDLRRVELAVDVRVAPAPELTRAVSIAVEDESDLDDDASGPERRRSPRGVYSRRVPAFGERAMRVLVARDLSVGGMRVEHLNGLGVGDRLHLAIYGAAAGDPTLVWATVARDDGREGIALVFDDVPSDAAERIEKVLVDLPAIESLHDDEAGAMGTVMTEILEA